MHTSFTAHPQGTELAQHFKVLAPFLRIDTIRRFVDTVLAIISAQSVTQSDLAPNMPRNSSIEAKSRRVERTMQDSQLTADLFLILMLTQLPKGKLLLSIDRTNWERGEASLNLLVLGVVVNGYTIPLVWTTLDHSGNSDTKARQWLILQLLKYLPAQRWLGIVADREFIGAAWFRFLRRCKIRRALRIKKSARINGLRAAKWFEDIKVNEFYCLAKKANIYGEVMQVVATRSPAGDLVLIATDFGIWETLQMYRQRWSIECTFSSMKTRGFNLERTGITQGKRLCRLFGLVTLAWVCCLKVGVWFDRIKPIKVLVHGRRAKSLIRYGAEQLRNALRWDIRQLYFLIQTIIQPFYALGEEKSGVVRY